MSRKLSLVPFVFFLLISASHPGSFAQQAPAGNAAQPEADAPPQIIMQPSSLTITAPAVATFSVYANSTLPMTVQWYKRGVLINGATDWTYVTAETTIADNGAKFYAIVKNSAGSTKSANAVLTVKAPTLSGTSPIVGEWSGTATIRNANSTPSTANVTVAFSQTSYSLTGTVVYTDDNGIPNYGVAVASLNGSNLFTAFGDGSTAAVAAGFSTDQLTMNGIGTETDGLGKGTLKISADHKTLTGSATDTSGDSITWTLTRDK